MLWQKYLTKATSGRMRFGSQFERTVHHSQEDAAAKAVPRQLVTLCHGQEIERENAGALGAPVCEMGPPAFSAGVSSSAKPLWKHSQKHPPEGLSLSVIRNPAKLTRVTIPEVKMYSMVKI